MSIIINPGTGPVTDATEAYAWINIGAFVADLAAAGPSVPVFAVQRQDHEDRGGRYSFQLHTTDDRWIEVDMPGIPLDKVRYIGEGQNIWDFPRLYVDGASWVWCWALSMCMPQEDDE